MDIPFIYARYNRKFEEYFYDYKNLLKKYITSSSGYFENDTSWYQGHINYNATEWRYRYNPFGEREQKRMYRAEDQSSAYPWVYNLMGLNNMQYAVYHGYQTDDEYTQHYTFGFTQKPDIWKPVVFLYPAEYNIFTLGSSPKYTYKYRNNMWEKQYKIYDYLGSLKAVTEEDGTVLTRKSYLPYGELLETELEPQTKGYIGKERDKENNLGDHGVRKYDSQIGRFTSIDPLWEMYMGWTPYQYCGNNPVNTRDGNGLLLENPDGSLKSKSQDKKNPSSLARYLFTERSKQLIPAVNGSASNCAGYALTGEFHWDISTFDGMVVVNDEYNKVEDQNDVQKDDIIVYFDKKGNPVHFGRIIGIKYDEKGNVVDMTYQWVDGSSSWETVPNKTSVNDLYTSKGYGNKKLYSRSIFRKKDGLNKPRKLEEKSNIVD